LYNNQSHILFINKRTNHNKTDQLAKLNKFKIIENYFNEEFTT